MGKFITVLILSLSVSILGQIRVNPINEKKIDNLLKKMTLEEKVGQMTQITLGVFSTRESEASEPKLNIKKLKEGILKYHIGSILFSGGAANCGE